MDLSKFYNMDFGRISLDQEKAFDRMDHGYLFSGLVGFGVGENFVSIIKMLYKGDCHGGEGDPPGLSPVRPALHINH